MNKTRNSSESFIITNVASGRNSMEKFYCRKNYVLEYEYTFEWKYMSFFRMLCFKRSKTCKWKRFIRRKDFVMDSPVYTLKASQCGFLFRIWLCQKFWSRRFRYLRVETVYIFFRLYLNIQFYHPTGMFPYRIAAFEITSIYYFFILLSHASAINIRLQGTLSCKVIHFNIIFQIRE